MGLVRIQKKQMPDASFQDLHTGKFTEVMLIRDNRDMDLFLEKYDISVAEIKTEW